MAFGPAAGIALAGELAEADVLNGYRLLPSVRGNLLESSGAPRRPGPSSSTRRA